MTQVSAIEAEAERWRETLNTLAAGVETVLIGQARVVRQTIIALAAGGHVLLEGVPGLGKTLLVRTLAGLLDLRYGRIQFTPDLMPADITGTLVVTEDERGRKAFEFRRGPIFAQLLLADEINRATPKTQSALLEAMQEEAVTAGGQRHALEPPFFVLATQNPIELEGTYPLPEAQLDRFLFKVLVEPPAAADWVRILQAPARAAPPAALLDGPRLLALRAFAERLPAALEVLDYVARLCLASHPDAPEAPPAVRERLRLGVSPRGAQALLRAARVEALWSGRLFVSPADVRTVAAPALRHRLLLGFAAAADGLSADAIVEALLAAVDERSPAVRELLR